MNIIHSPNTDRSINFITILENTVNYETLSVNSLTLQIILLEGICPSAVTSMSTLIIVVF